MQGVQCTRAQRCGGPKFARRCFLKFFGEEGALLEYLHAGPLQPCYATEAAEKAICFGAVSSLSFFNRPPPETNYLRIYLTDVHQIFWIG